MLLTSRSLLTLTLALAACAGETAEPDAGTPAPDAVVVPDAGQALPDAGPGPEDARPRTPQLTFLDLAPPALTDARDVTPDGRRALFEAIGEGSLFLVDTETGQAELQASLSFVHRNQALGMAADGTIVAEYGYPVQAGVWSATEGWRELGSPFASGCFDPGMGIFTDVAGAWDISAAGDVVVGIAYEGCAPRAFAWRAGVMTSLQVLGATGEFFPEGSNRATVVSDDGLVIGGWASNGPVDRSPAIWRADGTGFLLDPNDMDAPGEILSISSDGSVVAGIWNNEGFLWSERDGRVELGRLPETLPFDGVFPNAMAAGGELIFGTNGGTAFVWTRAGGMRPLAPIVRAEGLELAEGIFLTNVLGASNDGAVIVGSALDTVADPFGKYVGFVLTLPVSAYGL